MLFIIQSERSPRRCRPIFTYRPPSSDRFWKDLPHHDEPLAVLSMKFWSYSLRLYQAALSGGCMRLRAKVCVRRKQSVVRNAANDCVETAARSGPLLACTKSPRLKWFIFYLCYRLRLSPRTLLGDSYSTCSTLLGFLLSRLLRKRDMSSNTSMVLKFTRRARPSTLKYTAPSEAGGRPYHFVPTTTMYWPLGS